MARRLEVGTANVNDVLVGFLASDVPMGGWKDSGIGFRHGEYGIKKFVRPESLVITRFGGKREPLYFPYTLEAARGLAQAHRLLQRARLAPPARPPALAAPAVSSPSRRRASCSNHSETSRSQATSERVLIRT